jgi:hypothetical protein
MKQKKLFKTKKHEKSLAFADLARKLIKTLTNLLLGEKYETRRKKESKKKADLLVLKWL